MAFFTMGVIAKFGWPTTEVEIEYEGKMFVLSPETDEHHQTVSTHYDPKEDIKNIKERVNRFLSALSWAEESGIEEVFSVGTGANIPSKIGKSNTRFISRRFTADYLPVPNNEREKRALALYREALSVNSIPYSYLGFFKIFNILFETGRKQKDWINQNIGLVSDKDLQRRLAEIKQSHKDVGDYFYTQGRCAVAHAFNKPVIDPDNPEDVYRLNKDIKLIRFLAEAAIQNELSIISKSTFHANHLYELEGFKELFGNNVVECLKNGNEITETVTIPSISIKMRDQEQFEALENLSVKEIRQDKSKLILELATLDNLVHTILILDFIEWRLIFDPFKHIGIEDDKTEKPYEYYCQILEFTKKKFLNGETEVYNANNGKLLGRTDPFIPVNIDIVSTQRNLDEYIKSAKENVEKRKDIDA